MTPKIMLVVGLLLAVASLAAAQTPCEDHCRDRFDDCLRTCRARSPAEAQVCVEACTVEAHACTGLCDVRGR